MQRLCQIYSRRDQQKDADSRDQQKDADSRDQQDAEPKGQLRDAAPRETSGGEKSEIKALSRKDIASGMVNTLLFSCRYGGKTLVINLWKLYVTVTYGSCYVYITCSYCT